METILWSSALVISFKPLMLSSLSTVCCFQWVTALWVKMPCWFQTENFGKSSTVEQWLAWLPHSKKKVNFTIRPRSFCKEFACSPRVCMVSIQVCWPKATIHISSPKLDMEDCKKVSWSDESQFLKYETWMVWGIFSWHALGPIVSTEHRLNADHFPCLMTTN